MNIDNIILSLFMIIFYCIISYNLPYFPIKNDNADKIKQRNRSIIQKIIKDKKNAGSLISNCILVNNAQNSKKENARPIIIKIAGNTINNNNYHMDGVNGNKNEMNNFNPLINNNNIELDDNCLKKELDNKNLLIQKEKQGDGDGVDFQSKDYIIEDLQSNVGVLKLNENKNN